MDTNIYIKECNKVHNGKYDYSKTNYINAKTKVTIICPNHGEFKQNPYSHKKGSGCSECGKLLRKNNKKISRDKFIKECNKVHNGKYDYSKINNLTQKTKVTIICPNHGEFKQLAWLHKKGSGCSECANNLKKNNLKCTGVKFINKLINFKYYKKYDYSKVNYINAKTKVTIICPDHGVIENKPDNILQSKKICNKCHPKKTPINKLTTKEYIKRAKKIHGDKYDYSKVNYVSPKKYVTIICPNHGEFKQLAYNHINTKNNRGCRTCAKKYNKKEDEVYYFIKSLMLKPKKNNRKILNGKELDIYIPTHNLAIEYNGLYWHNNTKVSNKYHLNKTELCESQGIHLIHIFGDEWVFNKEIVKSRLKNILGITTNKIYGRKCEIREVPTKIKSTFLDNNHIQGKANSNINLGLYYNDELVSLMTFSRPRLGIGGNHDGYELVRFCNKINTTIIGGFSKLLKNFIKTYKPKEIISYGDRRWSNINKNVYQTNGFKLEKINRPNYWYIVRNKRKHRFGFRKNKLKDMGYKIDGKTEKQITEENKIHRIYDSGTLRYVLKF